MRPRSPLSRSIAALCPLVLLASAVAASAQTLVWDADANASNNNVSGAGLGNATTNVWDTAEFKWWLSGSSSNQVWGNTGTEIANFLGTAGPVTLGTAINAAGLIFDSPGFYLDATAAQALTLGGNGILVNAAGGATTIGSANLSLNLSAAQSWVNNSTGTLTIAGAVSNGANLLTVGGSGNTTINGVIGSGAGGLTKIGAGVLTLGAASNTFTGAVSVNDGTLSFGKVAALGTNASMNLGTASSVGTLAYTGATATLSTGIVLAAPTGSATGNTITAPSGTTLTITGVISGGPAAGATNTALTLSGGGSFALTAGAGNTFTGNVLVTGPGTKLVVSTTQLNNTDVNNGQLGAPGAHTYTFDNGAIYNQTTSTVNPTGASGKNWVVGPGGATFDIASGAILQLDDAGQFSGSGDLTKAGTGTLTLGNTSISHTYTGANANVNAGVLKLQNGAGLGTVGTINIGDTTGSAAASLQISSGTVANTTALVVRSGSSGVKTIAGVNTSGTVGFNSPLTLNDNVTLDAASGGTLNLGGNIIETASKGITKTGLGTVTLSGANSYTGGTTISGGLLRFGATAGTVPGTGAITINAGGALAGSGPSGFSSVAEWLGSGRIATTSAGALALTANDSTDYDLAMPGYNSLYLGATASVAYTGTITPGNAGYRLGSGGGTLTLPNTNALTGGNAVSIGSGVNSPGTVVLTGANDYTGATTINPGGVLNIQNGGALGGTAGGTTVAAGGSLQLQGGVTVTGEALTINGVLSTDAQPNGLVNVSGNNEWSGSIAAQLGNGTAGLNARIVSNAGTLTVSGPITVSGGSTVTTSLVLGGAGNGVVSGAISGSSTTATTLIKTNGGVWTLSGNNTYTNGTRLDDGALVLASANALPGGIGLTGGASNLSFNGTAGSTTAVVILGNGDFTRGLGTGATQVQWTLSGGFAASGATRNVNLGGAGATVTWGSGGFVLASNNLVLGHAAADATVNFQNPIAFGTAARTVQVQDGGASIDAVLSGALTGGAGGGLTKSGAGALALTSTGNNYPGATTITGGALVFNAAGAAPSASNYALNGGVIGLGAGNSAFTGTIGTAATNVQWTGSGGFAAFGADATVNLNGGATLTWASTANFVSTGSLILGSSNADRTVTFQNAIDLNGAARTIQVDDGSAAIDAILSGAITGAAASSALTKTGAGTLQLTNAANSFTGALTIGAGAITTSDLALLGGASLGLGTTTTAGTLLYTGPTATYAKNIAVSATTANAGTISAPSGTTLTLGGVISGGTSGTAGLVFKGGGTFDVTNTAPTYVGNYVIDGSTFIYNALTDFGPATSNTTRVATLQNGAVLSVQATLDPTNSSGTGDKRIVIGAGGATVDVGSGFTYTLNDAGQFSGTGDLTKAGAGTMTLGQASTGYTYTGANANVNAGVLQIMNATGLGSVGTINLGDTTGSNTAKLQLGATTTAPAIAGTTALTVRGGSTGAKTLASGNTSGVSVFNGPITLGDNLTIDTAASGEFRLTGNIGETGGARSLTKTSAGMLTLGGTNSYSGVTTVSAGTLLFEKRAALYNTDTARWTASNLIVNSGTTGAFSVGGADEFTAEDIELLKTLGTGSGGFRTGSFLGLDTTNAGGTFTYSGVISNPNGGANTLGFQKLGAGVLELTKVQAYTGPTAVAEGTLKLSVNNALTSAASLTFGGVAATVPTSTVGTLDLSGANLSVGAVNAFTNSASANTLIIGAGQTLSSSGGVNFGPTVSTTTAVGTTTVLNTSGGGAWNVSGTGLTFRVGGSNATNGVAGSTATLDLSGLGTFSASLGSGGALRLGNADTSQNPSSRDVNTLILAPTSTITAGTLDVGGSVGHQSENNLVLGTGVNTINADNINVGSATGTTGVSSTTRSNGKISFLTAGTGSVKIRAANGTGAATLNILNSTSATGTPMTGDLLLAGNLADVLAGNVTIASRNTTATWTTPAHIGTLTFDQGVFTASNLVLSNRAGSSVTTGTTTATATFGGGTVSLGAVTMATNSATTTASNSGNAIATLNIAGTGTTQITSLTLGNNTVSGTGATAGTNATVNISGSTISLTGATPIVMALNNAAAGTTTTATAALNISGGATTLANGGINMANAAAGQTSTSAITLTGGSLTLGGSLTRTGGLGTENTSLLLDGGTLDMGGFFIGDGLKSIGSGSGSLSFQSGTLKNVGEINGGAPLNKTGAGTLVLAGTNLYAGGTNIAAGTLLVSGSITGSVNVSANAILGGDGTIAPSATKNITVDANGVIAPGAGVGTLTIDAGNTSLAALSLTSGAKFTFELNSGLAGDKISLLHGTANDIAFNNNTINFSDLSAGALSNGVYTLFSSDTPNAYSGLTVNGSGFITAGLLIGTGLEAYPGASLKVVGNDIVLTSVPEPGSAAMLLAGLGSLLGLKRLRRRA